MPNKKNIDVTNNLKTKVRDAKSLVFAEYKGLGANKVNELKQLLSKSGAETSVSKNTLLKIALKENKYENTQVEKDLVGQTITILSFQDPIAPIKTLFEFIKNNELPIIKSGIVEGNFVNDKELEALSKLPAKEILIAQVLGGLKAPMNGLVNTVSGVQRKFVYALADLSKKKTKETN